MSSFFYFAMLIAIGWLAVWGALPRPWKGGGWWPFDMREPADAPPPPRDTSRQAPRRGVPPRPDRAALRARR